MGGPLPGSNRTVKLIDLSDKIVPYQTGWQMQKDVLQKQLDAETALKNSVGSMEGLVAQISNKDAEINKLEQSVPFKFCRILDKLTGKTIK